MRKLFIFIMAGLFFFTGCGGNQAGNNSSFTPPEDNVLQLSSNRLLQSLDPIYVHSQMEIFLTSLVFEGLVKEKDGEIIPALAKDWQISENGASYTFFLNRGISFHNGRFLTADDIKFSWERALRFKAASSYIFANIKGYEEVISEETKELAGVSVLNDYTLRVDLKTPQANFLAGLAMPAASALNRLEIVEQGADFARPGSLFKPYPLPSGTGPFRFAEWLENKAVVLGSFDDYYGEKSKLSRIELALNLSSPDALIKLQGGNLDIVLDLTPGEIDFNLAHSGLETIMKPVRTINYLVCSPLIEPFNNEQIRKGIFAAVSSNSIIEKGLGNSGISPAEGFVNYWYNMEQGPISSSYQGKGAKEILEAAGYGEGGLPLPGLVLDCGPNEYEKKIALAIAQALNNAGFRVEIKSHSYSGLRQLILSGNTGFYLGEFSDKGGGMDSFFSEVIDPRWQGVIPPGSWSSLLEAGYTSFDDAKKEAFAEAEERLFNESVLYFLAYQQQYLAAGGHWVNISIPKKGGLDWEKIFPWFF